MDKIITEIYETVLKDRVHKINTNTLPLLLLEIMTLLNNPEYLDLEGQLKKEIAIKVIRNVIIHYELQNQEFMLFIVDKMVPILIEAFLSVSKGKLLKKESKRCFGPLCFFGCR